MLWQQDAACVQQMKWISSHFPCKKHGRGRSNKNNELRVLFHMGFTCHASLAIPINTCEACNKLNLKKHLTFIATSSQCHSKRTHLNKSSAQVFTQRKPHLFTTLVISRSMSFLTVQEVRANGQVHFTGTYNRRSLYGQIELARCQVSACLLWDRKSVV